MQELRRYSFDMRFGTRTDSLTIKELDSGALEIGQDDGDRECVHSLSLEQTRSLVEQLGLNKEADYFSEAKQFVEDGKALDLVSVLHSGDFRATYVWP